MNGYPLRWLLPLLVLTGCESFAPWSTYAPDDPNLQYIGRMDFSSADGPTYAHPGGTVRFRCDCTGVDVRFADKGEGGAEHTNYIGILVDGVEKAKVELKPKAAQPEMLKGARDLPSGEHLIELVKRTESYAGDVQFLGVSVQGLLLAPPEPKQRKIEVIGDSISCGYGDEVRIYAPTYTEPNTGYHSKNEDITQAYGWLLGQRFDADVFNTCISGTGIYRNLNGETDRAKTFPGLYTRTFPQQEDSRWDVKKFVPDIIVINLGNNDFNVPDATGKPSAPDEGPFNDAYAAFVHQLRGWYPQAKIICSVGPMMNDNYPAGGYHWTKMKTYVHDMVTAVNAAGDANVYYFEYTPIMRDPYGEDWHPTAESHAQMAKELGDYLSRTLGF